MKFVLLILMSMSALAEESVITTKEAVKEVKSLIGSGFNGTNGPFTKCSVSVRYEAGDANAEFKFVSKHDDARRADEEAYPLTYDSRGPIYKTTYPNGNGKRVYYSQLEHSTYGLNFQIQPKLIRINFGGPNGPSCDLRK